MKRAQGDADKNERRRSILNAAEVLLRDGGGGLPSAAAIASAGGLAKGTLYIYFRTKEEIFAALLLHLWDPAFSMLVDELTRTDRVVADRIEKFVTGFVSYVDERPFLLRLDAVAKEVIERNMSVNALIAYKEAFGRSIEAVGIQIEAALDLPRGKGFQLVTRSHALMRGLWQSFGDPLPALESYRHHPFATELRDALIEYWRGALSR